MKILVLIAILTLYTKTSYCQQEEDVINSTDPNHDMYVIRAMVYQVGIVSNGTEGDPVNSTMGNQEALTLYRTNGSSIDLSKITSPLVTNVTAQSIVGVAPKTDDNMETHQLPWAALDHLTNQEKGFTGPSGDNQWTAMDNNKDQGKGDTSGTGDEKVKRSLEEAFKSHFKRDVPSVGHDTVAILKGKAEIPKELGIQSISLPPLLSLNNNFTDIPVPIPNTSVVHYAKINTLVHIP